MTLKYKGINIAEAHAWAEQGPKLLAALKGGLSSLEEDYLADDPFLVSVKEAIRAAEAIGAEK